MVPPSIKILVVDDHEHWCRLVSAMVGKQSGWELIGNACDGVEAVRLAEQLQPDLILLDIGLPKLNGLEAARRIRELAPDCKIVFVSENRSRDIAEEALNIGAGAYVVKSDAGKDLLPAINAVLEGKRFVSTGLTGL